MGYISSRMIRSGFCFSDVILKEIENLKEVTYAESLQYEIIPGKGS